MSCICRLEPRAAPQQLVLPYEVHVEHFGDTPFIKNKEYIIEIHIMASTSVYMGQFSPEVEMLDSGDGVSKGMHTITEKVVLDSKKKSAP